jgi:hypothetical protein
MKKRLNLLNCLAATLLLTGCMGYKLGGGKPAGINTVTMAPVINETSEPAIELQVTHAMREQIQFDGRLKLVNERANADAVMELTLTDYQLMPIAYRSELRTTPELYRLRVSGVAELRRISTGEVISTSQTYGESTFTFQSDLTTSKRDALPRAAQEIATYMLEDLIDQW